MKHARLAYLFRAYFNKTATDKEYEELMGAFLESKHKRQLSALLEEAWSHFNSTDAVLTQAEVEKIIDDILDKNKPLGFASFFYQKRHALRYAAAILFISLAIPTYFWLSPKRRQTTVVHTGKAADPRPVPVTDVAPGGNRAVLTIADGSAIVLDSIGNGTVTKQGHTSIIKTSSGNLAYTNEGKDAAETLQPAVFNTLTIPKGGQYQLVLSDGTKVWLNAASSLKYPTSFEYLKSREVELEGEAYFEVKEDRTKPFFVHTAKQIIEDMGTQFNVSAYADDDLVKTTLLGGSVKINDSRVLTPGQQAVVDPKGHISVSKVETAPVVAWKNGYFEFDDEDIYDIMRKVSRWYNVEVIYEKDLAADKMEGSMSRFANVSSLLNILQKTKLFHFRIDQRKIYVF